MAALRVNGFAWERIANRRVASGVAGAALVLMVAGCSVAETDASVATDALLEEAAAVEDIESELSSYVGRPCEFDFQVMTRGAANIYCDEDETGALIWVDQAAHDRAKAERLMASPTDFSSTLDPGGDSVARA